MLKTPPPVNDNRSTKGFTLTELAIVLGVAGIILGAIWVAGAAVYRNQRVAKAQQQITILAANVKSHYSTRNSFPSSGTNLTDELFRAGVIPSDMGSTSSALTSGIDGLVTLASWGSAAPYKNFAITLSNIRSDAECRSLAVRTAGDNPIIGLQTENPSTGQVYNNINGWRTAAAATSVGSGTCSSLAWRFSLK